MLVRKDDVKEFNKEKDPVIAILKGETKADPILKTGEVRERGGKTVQIVYKARCPTMKVT